jgi:hypothetical protein
VKIAQAVQCDVSIDGADDEFILAFMVAEQLQLEQNTSQNGRWVVFQCGFPRIAQTFTNHQLERN